MSLASKVTLGLAVGFAVGIIYYVQSKQLEDIQKMHEGVIRDRERQQRRKAENLYLLQQQAELGKVLRKQSQDEEVVLTLLQGAKEGGS